MKHLWYALRLLIVAGAWFWFGCVYTSHQQTLKKPYLCGQLVALADLGPSSCTKEEQYISWLSKYGHEVSLCREQYGPSAVR